jgi:hypothetical protein
LHKFKATHCLRQPHPPAYWRAHDEGRGQASAEMLPKALGAKVGLGRAVGPGYRDRPQEAGEGALGGELARCCRAIRSAAVGLPVDADSE